MGQRHAIAMFLFGGVLLIPLVWVAAFALVLGGVAIPVTIALLAIGIGLLVIARRLSSQSDASETTASRLVIRKRRAFLLGLGLVACSVCIALAALLFRYAA